MVAVSTSPTNGHQIEQFQFAMSSLHKVQAGDGWLRSETWRKNKQDAAHDAECLHVC